MKEARACSRKRKGKKEKAGNPRFDCTRSWREGRVKHNEERKR